MDNKFSVYKVIYPLLILCVFLGLIMIFYGDRVVKLTIGNAGIELIETPLIEPVDSLENSGSQDKRSTKEENITGNSFGNLDKTANKVDEHKSLGINICFERNEVVYSDLKIKTIPNIDIKKLDSHGCVFINSGVILEQGVYNSIEFTVIGESFNKTVYVGLTGDQNFNLN